MLDSRKFHLRSTFKCETRALDFYFGSAGKYALVAIGILVCYVLPLREADADERLAYDPANRDDEIRRLINQLDDRSYSTRESASVELAKIGAPALRALAMTVFEASPETSWRTKKGNRINRHPRKRRSVFEIVGDIAAALS